MIGQNEREHGHEDQLAGVIGEERIGGLRILHQVDDAGDECHHRNFETSKDERSAGEECKRPPNGAQIVPKERQQLVGRAGDGLVARKRIDARFKPSKDTFKHEIDLRTF